MTPEIRAIADRFIMDTANLKYLASGVSKDALERPVEVLGWTVRQATCESGGAFIAWSGGTFDQALGLVQQAAACVRPS